MHRLDKELNAVQFAGFQTHLEELDTDDTDECQWRNRNDENSTFESESFENVLQIVCKSGQL